MSEFEREDELDPIIDAYSVDQALADGVLIDLLSSGLVRDGDHIRYVTRTVWHELVSRVDRGRRLEMGPLRRLVGAAEERVRRVLAVHPDEWYVPVAGPYVAALGQDGRWVLMRADEY